MNFLKKHYFLILIIIAGLALRLWGINFGLPYQFHQDEPIVVNHALAYGAGDFNPHFFAIPPLTSYILFLIYGIYFLIGKVFGIFQAANEFAFTFFKNPTIFYLLGRLFIGVIPGTLAIIFGYRLYRKVFPSLYGALFTAALIAFNFLSVADSHYVYTDMLMSVGILLSIAQLIKMYSQPSLKNYILSGIWIGLATGIKYNAVLLFAPLLAAHFFLYRDGKAKLLGSKILLGVTSLSIIFFICNPFSLFDFKFFVKSLVAQGGASGYTGWLHHIRYSLFESIGKAFFIFGLTGMALAFKKDNRRGCLLFLFPFLFYLHLVFLSQQFPRYAIPLIPFFGIAAGWLIFEYIVPKLGSISAKRFAVIVVFLLFIPLLAKSITADLLFTSGDTRIEAASWIKNHLAPGDRIALDHSFFRPSIVQNKEQLAQKHQYLNTQEGLKGIKEKKLAFVLQAYKENEGYYIYFLSHNPEAKVQFLATVPSLPFDFDTLRIQRIEYVVVNYVDRQKNTEDFYRRLAENATLVASFSPYKDGSLRFSYDLIANTSLPLLSREIYSRKKSGPALAIYRVNK
jgi:4-amino-4-deoxy-L-arabinose transferase-like glycosyltransferase